MQLIKKITLGKFKKLGLSKPILKVLDEMGFEKPTEIQEQAIPQLLSGFSDFIGLAQTGTGKTAAFGLPLLERIDPSNKATQALVLAPTRELGQQIAEQLKTFSKYQEKVNVLAVYGGAAISNQIKALKKPVHVIIATPGRLIDLIKRKAVFLEDLEYLVLDEADEMLNMGFKQELDKILSYTPDHKLTWLFSATMPSEIKKIVKKYMDDPVEVKIDSKNIVNTDIKHVYSVMKRSDKTEALCRFIDIYQDMRAVVFCRTKRDTQDLAEELLQLNYKADAIHGDLSQKQRDRVMGRFKKNDLQLLIATDVAARGIDVNDLTHVFHHTLPDDESYYTHRSGRTARAGKKGTSICFINSREGYKIRELKKKLKIDISQVEIPAADDIASIRIEKWAETIAQTQQSERLNSSLVKKVNKMFSDLSKDELVEKLLSIQLDQLNLGSNKNLNREESEERRGGGGGRGRSGGRGGRGGRRREYGGKGRSGGSKSHRKGKGKGKSADSKGKKSGGKKYGGKKKKY